MKKSVFSLFYSLLILFEVILISKIFINHDPGISDLKQWQTEVSDINRVRAIEPLPEFLLFEPWRFEDEVKDPFLLKKE